MPRGTCVKVNKTVFFVLFFLECLVTVLEKQTTQTTSVESSRPVVHVIVAFHKHHGTCENTC